MSKQAVRRWYRQFTAGRHHMHDEERSRRPFIITDDLAELVRERFMENRCFPIKELSSHFPQISQSLLHKIVTEHCCLENCAPGRYQSNWHQKTKQSAWSQHWHFCSGTMMTAASFWTGSSKVGNTHYPRNQAAVNALASQWISLQHEI